MSTDLSRVPCNNQNSPQTRSGRVKVKTDPNQKYLMFYVPNLLQHLLYASHWTNLTLVDILFQPNNLRK